MTTLSNMIVNDKSGFLARQRIQTYFIRPQQVEERNEYNILYYLMNQLKTLYIYLNIF